MENPGAIRSILAQVFAFHPLPHSYPLQTVDVQPKACTRRESSLRSSRLNIAPDLVVCATSAGLRGLRLDIGWDYGRQLGYEVMLIRGMAAIHGGHW